MNLIFNRSKVLTFQESVNSLTFNAFQLNFGYFTDMRQIPQKWGKINRHLDFKFINYGQNGTHYVGM